MEWLFEIVIIVAPIILGVYLSTIKRITKRAKKIAWVICIGISIIAAAATIEKRVSEKKKTEQEKYYRRLQERDELYHQGKPQAYIDGLGEHPLFKHYYNRGRELYEKSQFNEAIDQFKHCLDHPQATAANKAAAHNLIGNCYLGLSMLKDAEKHYRETIRLLKQIDDQGERRLAEAKVLGNIGLVYQALDEPAEALECHREALEIDRKIGYELGVANQLGNIGLIYQKLGQPTEALKYHKEALEIARKIGYDLGVAASLGNIGLVYQKLGQPTEALKNYKKVLEISKKIGNKLNIANTLGNIGLVYQDLGQPQ